LFPCKLKRVTSIRASFAIRIIAINKPLLSFYLYDLMTSLDVKDRMIAIAQIVFVNAPYMSQLSRFWELIRNFIKITELLISIKFVMKLSNYYYYQLLLLSNLLRNSLHASFFFFSMLTIAIPIISGYKFVYINVNKGNRARILMVTLPILFFVKYNENYINI